MARAGWRLVSLDSGPLAPLCCLLFAALVLISYVSARRGPVDLPWRSSNLAGNGAADRLMWVGGTNDPNTEIAIYSTNGSELLMTLSTTPSGPQLADLATAAAADTERILRFPCWNNGGVANEDLIYLLNMTNLSYTTVTMPQGEISWWNNNYGRVESPVAPVFAGAGADFMMVDVNGTIFNYGFSGSVIRGVGAASVLVNGTVFTAFVGGTDPTAGCCPVVAFPYIWTVNHTEGLLVQETAQLGVARYDGTAVASQNLIIFAGGTTNGFNFIPYVDVFDFNTRTITMTFNMLIPRREMAGGVLGPYAYFAGGLDPVFQVKSSTVQVLDLRRWVWTQFEDLTEPACTGAAVVSSFGIFFGGGQDPSPTSPTAPLDYFVCGNGVLDVNETCDDASSLDCAFCHCAAPSSPCPNGAFASCCRCVNNATTYGPYCTQCSKSCATCSSGLNGTGACLTCSPLIFGTTCQFSCPAGCTTCNDGPAGNGNCLSCPPDVFGFGCEFNCSVGCSNCSDGPSGSGSCVDCVAGYWGPNCLACSAACAGGCDDGIAGIGSCKSCFAGFYGPYCQPCSSLCATCDSGILGTGRCLTCYPNATGATCSKACNCAAAYGQVCNTSVAATTPCLSGPSAPPGVNGTLFALSFPGALCGGAPTPQSFGAYCFSNGKTLVQCQNNATLTTWSCLDCNAGLTDCVNATTTPEYTCDDDGQISLNFSCTPFPDSIVDHPAPANTLPTWAIAVIAVVIALLIGAVIAAVILIIRRRQKGDTIDAASLPDALVEYFSSALLQRAGYLKDPESEEVLRKQFEPGSREYQKVLDFLSTFLDGAPLVKTGAIQEIWGVHNRKLGSAFVSQRSLMANRIRKDPALFARTDWQAKRRPDDRRKILEHYQSVVRKYAWNAEELEAPIILSVHGTSGQVAWKIVENGFSALSSLDAGYYGSGIYFSTSAQYILPYYMTKKGPSVLVSLIVPGNPYPVVESRLDKDTILGNPLKSGYQSHYVVTTPDGHPLPGAPTGRFYDEIVIGQESQVFPIFVLSLDAEKLASIATGFVRDVLDPENRDGKSPDGRPTDGVEKKEAKPQQSVEMKELSSSSSR